MARIALLLLLACSAPAADLAFFEKKIRPVLAERCWSCHSNTAKLAFAGLKLDSKANLAKGSDAGPVIVPGDPASSRLYHALLYSGPSKMPPTGKLPDAVLADFRQWIAAGAPWPDDAPTPQPVSQANPASPAKSHWAWQPVIPPAVPPVRQATWPRNDIDRFVLAALEAKQLAPSPDAAPAAWLRRVSLDLTGLPPTLAEQDDFARHPSPEAVVDRLLASKAFGERWARHWLDQTYYADNIEIGRRVPARHAWRYRDYVIDALERDVPYNRFLTEQLAGDQLEWTSPVERRNNLVATGLLALGPWPLVNADKEQLRMDVVDLQLDMVGRTMLGLTLGCARCHDHKFDPIRQADYYRIQSYFSATHEKDMPLAAEAEQAAWEAKAKTIQEEIKTLKAELRGKVGDERLALEKKLEAANDRLPAPLPALYSVENDFQRVSPIHLLNRGEYNQPKEKVGARPLGVLLPDGAPERTSLPENPRTKLAEWLIDPENPLTARVIANRIWHWQFGRGLVATPNDFGKMGLRPTHPELLDYLANQLIAGGWRMKPLHRLLLTSSTWRQSFESPIAAQATAADPENKLLWHWSRRRLEAEELRDSLLAVSGKLNAKAGGPSVIVPVDPELVNFLYKPSQWAITPDPAEHDRRSVYLMAKRNLRLPMMETFDAPDLQISCARRESSTHAPQALELTNGDLASRMATAFARRIEADAQGDRGKMVEHAWQLATSRPPSAKERALALQYLNEGRPLREFALAVLNLNAFLYVD
jgi:hypothetical protein